MKTSNYRGPGDLKDCPSCAGCCISARRQGVENCQWGRPRLNQFELTQPGAQRKTRSLLQGAEFTSAPCCTRIPTTTAAPAPAAACKAAGVKAPGRSACAGKGGCDTVGRKLSEAHQTASCPETHHKLLKLRSETPVVPEYAETTAWLQPGDTLLPKACSLCRCKRKHFQEGL